MRRLLLCLVLALLPGVAHAEGWVAEMVEDEGGPVMMASVTGSADGDFQPMLEMTCADEGLGLRYLMATDDGQPGDSANFRFENEHDEIVMAMNYEAMDGAFAAYFPVDDPIVSLIETGADLFITQMNGNNPAQDFTLKGSTKAIAALLKTCK